MFRYNKLRLFIIIFFDLLFLAASIVFAIKVNDPAALYPMVISVVLTILLVKNMLMNLATARYEDAMNKKDYDLADLILTKNENKYPWFKILKVNLMLVKGDTDLYLYNYNNLELDLDKNEYRYYYYLLEIYKVYYDLICNNTIDFSKVNKIEDITETYAPKVCCAAIANLQDGKFQEAYDKAKHLHNQPSGDFSKFIYAYIQYCAAKVLGLESGPNEAVLQKLAYNDFLRQCVQNINKENL